MKRFLGDLYVIESKKGGQFFVVKAVSNGNGFGEQIQKVFYSAEDGNRYIRNIINTEGMDGR